MSEGETEAVARFIQDAFDRSVEAFKRGEFAAIVDELFAPDAVYVKPGATLVGRKAITEHFSQALATMTDGWIRSESVTVSGDVAYEFGVNSITLATDGGAPTTVRGRYLTVWRRQDDGSWVVVADAPMRDP